MICKKCGKEVTDGIKFCTNCGIKLVSIKFCGKCGTENDEGAIFCENCGEKFSSSESDRDGERNQEYFPNSMFREGVEKFHQHDWKEAFTILKMCFDSIDQDSDRYLLEKLLLSYYLTEISIVEWNNIKYDSSMLSFYLEYGYKTGSMLALLQIILLRIIEPDMIDEQLVAEVYQDRQMWEEKFIFHSKTCFASLKENEFQLLEKEEERLFLETCIYTYIWAGANKGDNIISGSEDLKDDSRGKYFLRLIRKAGIELENFNDTAVRNRLVNLSKKSEDYMLQVIKVTSIADDNQTDAIKILEKYAKKDDYISQLLLAGMYDLMDDERKFMKYLIAAADNGNRMAMREVFTNMYIDDKKVEAKVLAAKWKLMGYADAMSIYKEEFI